MIKRIEVEGYRLLDGFAADFRPLTVVIGANATGKSTLINCLQLIAQCAELPLNTALSLHWGMSSLWNAAVMDKKLTWKVVIEKPKNTIWCQLPLVDSTDCQYLYEVELTGDAQGLAQAQHEVLRTTRPFPRYTDPLIYLAANPYRRQIYSSKDHKLIPFDEALPAPNQVREPKEAERDDINLPLPAREPALMLSQIRFFNEFPVPSSVRVLLANMAFYPGFDVTHFSKLRVKAAEIKPITLLELNGENLGTVLHEILTRYDYRQSASDLREFMRSAYPTFDDIHCDTTFGNPPQVLVRVREKGMKRSFELYELSDGMLRFLCLAAALLNPIPPPVVIVDEPEAGLHPKLMPVIGDMILTSAERTQVLVTTHNPDLLNRFEISNIAVMARSEEEPKAKWHLPENRQTLVQMLKNVAGETLGELHRSGELEVIQ